MLSKTNLIIVAVSLLISCKICPPQKRAENKVAKIVECYPNIQMIATINIIDTIILPSVAITDTFFITKPVDTITFIQDNIKVKIRRMYDTVFVDTIMYTSDTVFIDREIIVKSDINVTKTDTFFDKVKKFIGSGVLWLFLIALVGFGLMFLFFKVKA